MSWLVPFFSFFPSFPEHPPLSTLWFIYLCIRDGVCWIRWVKILIKSAYRPLTLTSQPHLFFSISVSISISPPFHPEPHLVHIPLLRILFTGISACARKPKLPRHEGPNYSSASTRTIPESSLSFFLPLFLSTRSSYSHPLLTVYLEQSPTRLSSHTRKRRRKK